MPELSRLIRAYMATLMTWPPALDALVMSLALHPDSRIMILTVIQRDLADALRRSAPGGDRP
jgi:hypothetical protein